MKTSIVSLVPAALCLAVLANPEPAEAATCTISVTERLINGGTESGGGVPNYAQGSFEPGTNDCSPTAVGMVLGYWDANGWSCLMPNTGPYTGGGVPHSSIDTVVEYFKTNLNYSSVAGGTTHGPFDLWGPTIRTFLAGQDSGAAGWHVPDDFLVSHGDITSEIDAERPVVFSVIGVPGKSLTWNSPSGSSQSGTLNHSMAALGYRRVVEGDDFWGGCADWLDYDEFYVALRSGWSNGGNSRVYYHWEHWATKTAVKVEPRGTAACCASTHDGTCEEVGLGGTCAAGSDYFDCGYCRWPNDGECDEASGTNLCPTGSDTADCSSCAWTDDNECDEPEGTNLCPEGSDVNDCYCAWPNDGECDEPEGTNLCPEGSDAADC